jgi:hypothetical protein
MKLVQHNSKAAPSLGAALQSLMKASHLPRDPLKEEPLPVAKLASIQPRISEWFVNEHMDGPVFITVSLALGRRLTLADENGTPVFWMNLNEALDFVRGLVKPGVQISVHMSKKGTPA